MTLIAPTLQAYFSDRLVNQLHASPRTIGSLNRPGSVGDLDLPRFRWSRVSEVRRLGRC